ncbi:MAG: type II and III secretion system protein [Acidobacteriota bacterium]
MKCFSIAFVLLGLAAICRGQEETPKFLYESAQRAEAAGDTLNAFFLYGRAAANTARNSAFSFQGAAQSRLLQTRLQQSADVVAGPDPALDPAARMVQRMTAEQLSATDVIESRDTLLPAKLKPSSERKTFDIRGSIRPVWEEVARAYGIQLVFEPDFQAPEVITFRMRDASMSDAFRSMESASNTFLVAARENTALVFRDTPDKRTANTPVIAMAIPIPQRMSVQEAQELASGVQQIMELRHIAVDAGRRVIFLRDQEYKVTAARRIITDLARYRAQVMVEVELLSVANNSTLSYGFNLQNVFSFSTLTNPMTFARLGLSTSTIGLGITGAQAFATLSTSSARSSLRAQMVSLDGQQAQLHIGDRYPVVTGTFGDPTIPNSNTPVTQFQDLGLRLQITPTVHADGEMTLVIESEYSLLGGSSNNGIPVISSRKFSGTVRVKSDEYAIIAGLAVSRISHTINGVAGLSEIPGLGHLFRRETKSNDSGEVLIVLKPRLLSEPAWENPPKDFWIGTETKPPTLY